MPVLTNPTDVARETLKLMATRRLAPTPENYQRVYHEIAGTRPAKETVGDERLAEAVRQAVRANPHLAPLSRAARAIEDRDWAQVSALLVALSSGKDAARADWAGLLRDTMRALEARQTASALVRKKEGLERLLINFGSDPALYEKLQALVRSWAEMPEPAGGAIEVDAAAAGAGAEPPTGRLDALSTEQVDAVRQMREVLVHTLEAGVVARLERFPDLNDEARALANSARTARGAEAWTKFAAQLRAFFFRVELRTESDGELLDALLRLLGLLVNNISELVEDDQWLAGQLHLIREVINEPLTTDRISEAERRFKEVLYKQSMLKHSLQEAKSSLKDLISLFVHRLGEMTESTTDYHGKVEGYASRIQSANDIGSLKNIVDELMSDTRSMQTDMQRYRDEMIGARRQAEQAELKVRQLEAELEQVSEQVREDQLTGTLNRRGLDDAMEREIARSERKNLPLCVAVLDLDNFKRLNDTYGHQAGDEALVHLARVIKKTLRPTDIVARYGGEEFVCVFSETDLPQAVEVMKRVQRELTKRFFLHNNERLLITFSAGVARRDREESQESLVARADKAMYQAKLQGKNRVVAAEG
jgi:diguanylate cyclase